MLVACLQGKAVVAVTSGANIPFDRLRVVAELAELGAGREAMLASTITGRPGSLREVLLNHGLTAAHYSHESGDLATACHLNLLGRLGPEPRKPVP